jgi:hypothetical protein
VPGNPRCAKTCIVARSGHLRHRRSVVVSDADSVVQLLVGLNLAYFSFREIRAPALSKYLSNVSRRRELLSTLRQNLADFTLQEVSRSPWTPISSLACKIEDALRHIRMKLTTKEANMRFHTGEGFHWENDIDHFLRVLAFVIAAINFAFLVYSALHPSMPLRPGLFIAAVGISCVPTAFSIWFNWMSASTIRFDDAEASEHRREIEELIRSFRLEVGERASEIDQRLREKATRASDS